MLTQWFSEESRERTRLLWKTGSNFLMLVSPEGLRYFFRAVYFLLMQESFCIALSSRVLGLSIVRAPEFVKLVV